MEKKTKITKDTTEVKIEVAPEVKQEKYHYRPEVKKRISFIDWVIELLKDERGSTTQSINDIRFLTSGL